MKALFVGDVHTHLYMLDDVKHLDNKYNFDKIIFLGDYVDDWNVTGLQSSKTLMKMIELKESNKDKYVLCLGNHELSYLGYPCSGHSYQYQEGITHLLKDDLDLFDLYYKINLDGKDFYCSHAGFTTDYIQGQILGHYSSIDACLEFWNKNKLDYLHKLYFVTYLRGGDKEYSSFIWADYREHKYLNSILKPLLPYQIIGHSPVSTITKLEDTDQLQYFIDTHSTYSDGRNIGDKSYLMWNEDHFENIKGREDYE